MFLRFACIELLQRSIQHDCSKLAYPELLFFTQYTERLADSTYGSDEYYQSLRDLKPVLDHHYAVNRHHPEHFPDGIVDMTLIDLLEMLCDWQASVLRHKDGDIHKSMVINKDRFGIDDQLFTILKNTLKIFMDTPNSLTNPRQVLS